MQTSQANIFTAPREKPWRHVDGVPPDATVGTARFSGTARPGEFFVFQVGVAVTAPMGPLVVHSDDLRNEAGDAIAAAAVRILSLGGIGADGKPFTKDIRLQANTAQVLWFGVDVPPSASSLYRGQLELLAGNAVLGRVDVELRVEGVPVDDHGDSVAANLSRLRWLDSTAGDVPTVTKPFIPVEARDRTVRVLGRELRLGNDGLPAQIVSFFNPANTRITTDGRPVLAKPFAFVVEQDGGALNWRNTFGQMERTDVEAHWTARLEADGVAADVDGRLDYTGLGRLCVTLTAMRELSVRDIRLEVFWREDTSIYFMGLHHPGGRRPADPVHWRWNIERQQDCFWMGDVNAGLMLRFKDERYARPLVNIYYGFSPLRLPRSWANEGRGGIDIGTPANGVVQARAYSGSRTLRAGEMLTFVTDLCLTPFRPLDTEKQWATRFVHPLTGRDANVLKLTVKDMDSRRGPNVLNMHHAQATTPFINYPYSDYSLPTLREMIESAHARGVKARVYYTTREITQNMPELFALHSMNGEIIFPGPGKNVRTIIHKNGPHPWLVENLGIDFIPAWVDNLKLPVAEWDLSVLTCPDSRWNNFYLEGLKWMTDHLDLDGVYLDDTALDGNSLRRARRILDTRPGRIIDFHTWNHFNGSAGFGHNLLIYMELLPYLDRLWIGEGFNCNNASPDFWLVAMSGLPFGLMSEMLDGANPWRGLVFGETVRLGWSGDPRAIWKAWDEFGIQGTEFLPYFASDCPVRVNRKDVLASVYRRSGRTFVAIGSWAEQPCAVTLDIAWQALGLDPAKTSLYAPPIAGMQTESSWKPTDAISVDPGRGWFLVLDETLRKLAATFHTVSEIER